MPLGDLNWYPAEKAIWDTIQTDVFEYMKAGNTAPYRWATGIDDLDYTALPSRIFPTIVRQSAIIEFTMESAEKVEIDLYNTMGQKVAHLYGENKAPGTHRVAFTRNWAVCRCLLVYHQGWKYRCSA